MGTQLYSPALIYILSSLYTLELVPHHSGQELHGQNKEHDSTCLSIQSCVIALQLFPICVPRAHVDTGL